MSKNNNFTDLRKLNENFPKIPGRNFAKDDLRIVSVDLMNLFNIQFSYQKQNIMLLLPQDTFHQKTDVKSVILIYNLPPFSDVRNLTLNDLKFVI